ncbi:MAG: dienelactone hydrolase family protein [Agriterribacter sp.]
MFSYVITPVLHYSPFVIIIYHPPAQTQFPFASSPLTDTGDLSVKMVAGVNKFLLKETEQLKTERPNVWKRDFSSPSAFRQSIAAQQLLLANRLGVVETRVMPQLELVMSNTLQPFSVTLGNCTAYAVRWKVLDGLDAEGILLQPKGKMHGRIIMIPDADIQPEVLAGLQFSGNSVPPAALQLASVGFQVIIPALISRQDDFSGNSSLKQFSNQPHREWIYRQAYEVGRHVIGYELQKIFAAVDWFQSLNKAEKNDLPFGVAGYGEGGLLALYAAALDARISTTLVSGYFDARERLWNEPIYRNVFGLLKTFGDAELAVMAWPNTVIIEQCKGPEVSGPPAPTDERSGAAPGEIHSPLAQTAKQEFDRANAILSSHQHNLQWIDSSADGKPFSIKSIKSFAGSLRTAISTLPLGMHKTLPLHNWADDKQRQQRMVTEMEAHVQKVLQLCHRTRDENFWQKLPADSAAQRTAKKELRYQLGETLGQLPTPSAPNNTRARLLKETATWTSYEITLDVFPPEVFAWGILIIPKNIQPGERKPVVVCQHGLEGLPIDLMNTDSSSDAFGYYKNLAPRLAEKGYITFMPHNFYRGGDKFRVLQRMANPIGLTLFSVITSQHRRIVEWLSQQSFVDPARIGFYGLSYGGKTAMRVPAQVEGYALSICSADFNEWVYKVSTTNDAFGYVYTNEYDMPEWDLGHTFNYAEMAALIAPRPFMVERGHHDGVGLDEWVDFEYAKVRRHYAELGIPERTNIEHFNGPHTINGVGTFEFLDRFLKK